MKRWGGDKVHFPIKHPSSHAVRRLPRRKILTGKTGTRGTLPSGLSEVAVVYKALAQKFSSPVRQMFSVLWTLRLEKSWKNYPKWDVGKKFDSVIFCENVKKSFKWASLEHHTTNTRHSQWNWIFMKIFCFRCWLFVFSSENVEFLNWGHCAIVEAAGKLGFIGEVCETGRFFLSLQRKKSFVFERRTKVRRAFPPAPVTNFKSLWIKMVVLVS